MVPRRPPTSPKPWTPADIEGCTLCFDGRARREVSADGKSVRWVLTVGELCTTLENEPEWVGGEEE